MDEVSAIAGRLDAVVGDGIEAAVRLKHGWRMRRLGHREALHPPDDGSLWATGDPPPRDGCRLEVLIDGASAFGEMAVAIERARDYVYVAGWHIAPYFALLRGDQPAVLGTLLAEMAEKIDVRVLVWAGAPVPLFHPTRKEVAKGVETLTRRTKIRCQPDPREHPFHCHHEKLIVIDGEVAFVGGIDITDYGGDRHDSSRHPARRMLGWHDVGTRLHGPAVADVQDHIALRWHELTGERLRCSPPPGPAGASRVQVVRTTAEGMYDAIPKGEFRILESYVRAIRSACRFIYLENQFLWSAEIVALLTDKLSNPPCDDFRIVLVLPSKANNGQDDTKGQLGVLVDADDGSGRLLATTIRSLTGQRDDRLYVHAKVGIIDDAWLTVGSANLNAHSLFNDTEMNVATDDRELARATRLRLWAEHLELDPAEIADEDPSRTVDERWRPIATEQLRRLRADEPPTHRLIALPGVSKRSGRLLGPLVGLVDDG
ncbi:MAG TPA: phospholipase D family protein [Solirubrobacteraceae bacterium]|nr:phospholipase D family protein [Solirubrobacteraceae bacterium]